MTFNIQHGIDGGNKYNLQRAIDTIARVQPDIVGLQEVTRNHPYYNCDDQPAVIQAGLRAATGQAWDARYQQEWFTLDVSCQNSGRGDGPETEGLMLLTRRVLSGVTSTALPSSRIGFEGSLADAYGLPIIVTHLISGGASVASTRTQQLDRLLPWAAGFGTPRVLLGDFNAAPEAAELGPVFADYRDAWAEAQRIGRAIGPPTSHGSSRIDYIFFAPGSSVTLESAESVDTTAFFGVSASDHSPLVATFTIR